MNIYRNDSEIVSLYWGRDEKAITATAEKYGNYCRSIAKNILGNDEDAEECVSDTYLNAWNAIPPHRPENLATFLGRITRNLSFNRYKNNRAEKRGGGETALVLDELEACVSGSDNVVQSVERAELIGEINAFVKALPTEKRNIFVRRYWYADPIFEIAKLYGKQPDSVAKTLERTRKQLKKHLLEKGYDL